MSTTALKLLALVLMVIDHVGEFIPGMSIWLRYIGRLSAPLFFFCMAWGLFYTHNRRIYLLRLYLCSVIMSLLDYIVPRLCGNYETISNNIFTTLFMAGVIITAIEYVKKNPTKKWKTILALLIWQLGTIGIGVYWDIIGKLSGLEIILTIAGSIVNVEGGIIILLSVIVIYFYKDNNKKLIIGYISYCIGYIALIVTDFVPRVFTRLDYYFNGKIFDTLIEIVRLPFEILSIETRFRSTSWHNAFFIDYFQWMMIFALPLMLLYNGKRGKGIKWFFYIFYPVHIIILYCVGVLL